MIYLTWSKVYFTLICTEPWPVRPLEASAAMIGFLLRAFNGFSYKEKSTFISLVAIAGIYGAYFFEVVNGSPRQSLSAMLATMIGLVVVLVVVHVVFHIVISLDDVPEAEDERDRAVNRTSSVVGYNVLWAGVAMVIGRILILGTWAEKGAGAAAPSTFEIANLLLGCLVASEVAYYASQLFLYRRGVTR